MTRITLIILATTLAFSNCKQAPKGASKHPNIEQPKGLTALKATDVSGVNTIDTARIDFGNFTVLMPDIEVYRNDSISGKDTIKISPEIGYDLDSQVVILQLKPNIKSVKIFESYKTVLSIMDEGPHLDLYDWKGYESDWMNLKSAGNKSFMMRAISEKDASRFPKFTKEELVELAEKAEQGWGDILRKPSYGSWKNHFWIGVGIRRIKFVVTDMQGKVFEKYLVAYIAMGC
jgi:hypothetical protein